MRPELTPALKTKIVSEARGLFRERYPDVEEAAACFYLTLCVIEVAQHHHLRLVPQAGSASWPRIRPEQDDGVCNTHFSYMWEADNLYTKMKLTMGSLPEVHVWAADPQRQEIIDLTTGHIPHQCKELTGMDWPGDEPPDHFWCGWEGLTENTLYRADPLATNIISNLMIDIIKGRAG